MTINNKYFELLKAKKTIYIKADKENVRFLNELKKECVKKRYMFKYRIKGRILSYKIKQYKKALHSTIQ